MKTIIYLIQVSACTGIFYLFYHLVLSRLTFFTINRWYLLATLLISFIIPAISFSENTIPQGYRVSSLSFSTFAEAYIPAGTPANIEALAQPFQWVSLLPVLYFAVAGIIALYFLFTLFILLRRIYTNQSAKTGNIRLLKTDKKYKSGSFFNCIFINDDKFSPEELEQIIAHELVHVEQKHSIDKITARIAQVILWFNPFVYIYSNAIDANHEYEVDHKVALNSNKEAYAQLILCLVTSGDGSLYHHFSKFPLSKRITLLFTKPTKNMKKLFYLATLPLLLVCCVFFAQCESGQPAANKADRKISAILAETELGENPLVLIDGKEYKPEKLDEIGRKNIGQARVIIRKAAGNNARGIVEISTKNGKIDQINVSSH